MTESRTRMTDPLMGKMWKTKSARFNAHLRLVRKYNMSTWATSILAFYIFTASCVPLIFPQIASGGAQHMVVFLTLIISVFLIILTLREGSKQYDREGEKMLQCSIQISRIYNTFQGLSPEVQDERRIEFTDEYSRVLDSFSLNHRDIDYLQFQLRNRSELHIGRIQYLVDLVKYGILSIAEYWLYLSLVIIPPLATFLLRHQLGF